MVYYCLIVYVVALFIRPAEILAGWSRFPFVELIAAFATVAAGFQYLAKPRKFWELPHDKFVAGMWFVIVISNLSWGWFGGAWMGFTEFLKVAFYYFLIRIAIHTPREFQGFLDTVVLCVATLAISGIFQFHTGFGLGGLPLLADGRIRGTGIFNDPNDLAMALVLVIPLLIDEAVDAAQRKGRRLVAGTLLLPIVTALFYTNSRGGMVGLGVVLVAQSFRRFGRVAGAGVAVLAIVATLAFGPSRMSMLDASEESAQDRIRAWGAALLMFKADPLFGAGYDQFLEFHELIAHNSFVHSFAELGLLGAFVFVGLCYWLLKELLTSLPADAPRRLERWRQSILVSAAGVLTSCCFLSRQYDTTFYTLIGMGACHVVIARAYGGGTNPRNTAKDLSLILVLTLTGIAMTWVAVRLLARFSGA